MVHKLIADGVVMGLSPSETLNTTFLGFMRICRAWWRANSVKQTKSKAISKEDMESLSSAYKKFKESSHGNQ